MYICICIFTVYLDLGTRRRPARLEMVLFRPAYLGKKMNTYTCVDDINLNTDFLLSFFDRARVLRLPFPPSQNLVMELLLAN